VRARGQGTVRRLPEAGLAAFGERGFQAVTVDDIVRRANASHGTSYLYFANKDDLFGVLAHEALHAMEGITAEFPVVTPSPAGRAALRRWVESFCDTYDARAAVIRSLSQAGVVGQDAWERPQATVAARRRRPLGNDSENDQPRWRWPPVRRCRAPERRAVPDDAGTHQLPAEFRDPAAQGGDDRPLALARWQTLHSVRFPPNED
jgi:AcrR family transcriptional regulator